MKNKLVYRGIGFIVFIISALQHVLTAQVSVPFWDPGELSAAAYLMQVPHPPGGPLFSMVGRIFYMLPIPGDLGYHMNLLSALSSVFTVVFLYLITVKVIENYKGKYTEVSVESVGTYLAAAIGALTLSTSDTFWFNSGESNYFAASMLLYSSIMWLMMLWNEKANEPGNERYLLLIAYIGGLSAGLHLMSVLTVFIVGLTVVLRKYIDNDKLGMESTLVFAGHMVVLFIVAAIIWSGEKATQAPTQEMINTFETKFKIIMLVVSVAFIALFRKKIFHLNSFYLAVLIGALALVVIFPGVIRYLPMLLLFIAGDHLTGGLLVLLGVLFVLGYGVYWARKKRYALLAFAFAGVMIAIIGFTTYTLIVIRANKNLPMNENHPNTFAKLFTYLNREQYGDFPMFKRRWSNEPEKEGIYKNYSSDLDFFMNYQMNHMFQRYVGWNFIGRSAHEQDAGVDWSKYFGIPFFLGLFGLYSHFRKDWKMATIFLITFILMGYLITYYQNQQQPQPRDREYFYCGAYFVFALWIALGIRGILDLIRTYIQKPMASQVLCYGVLGVCTLIPLRMFELNYPIYDRSKNWLAWDFAYNMLQTCEKDAILFTQGDNDTFPLWYIQDVAGVRRDVRIVNLSLVNTSWYILQIKGKPAYPEAKPVPMNLSDAQIEDLQLIQWEPRNVELSISREAIQQLKDQDNVVIDSAIAREGKISFLLPNTLTFGNTKALRVQDIAVFDIIKANEWKRPIYFASTCSPDAKIGLDNYLWYKGLNWKLEPRKVTPQNYGIDVKATETNLMEEPTGFYTTPHSGYKFRELANPKVFFDENAQRIINNYRSAFRGLAAYYMNAENNREKCMKLLDRMESLMPSSKIPYGWQNAWNMASFYQALGRVDRIKELEAEIEKECWPMIDKGNVDMNSYYNPYRSLIDIYDMTGEHDKSLKVFRKLAEIYPKDPSIKNKIQELESLSKQK